jgi:hypothetical protein
MLLINYVSLVGPQGVAIYIVCRGLAPVWCLSAWSTVVPRSVVMGFKSPEEPTRPEMEEGDQMQLRHIRIDGAATRRARVIRDCPFDQLKTGEAFTLHD